MNILVVGALEDFLDQALTVLCKRGYRVTHVPVVKKALEFLKDGAGDIQIILIDLGEDVLHFLEKFNAENLQREHFTVVACSTKSLDKTRVRQVLEAGVDDFIAFPPDSELIADLLDTLQKKHLKTPFLFQDAVMKPVIEMAKRVASSDASILITGESGTGKEVLSKYVHAHSQRSHRPFIAVNCAAIPENLLESELFGHEKGAFTGAVTAREGKFEQAKGGTLLLDEISEMSTGLQAKLLRAIQEKKIDRVGGKTPIPLDFRLITTSNRCMQQAIQEGSFREDLFFRISVVHLKLPALRERPKDISMLSLHFLKMFAKKNKLSVTPKLSADAAHFIDAYSWPGNVRELENAMHRGVLLTEDGVVQIEHLLIENVKNATKKLSNANINCKQSIGAKETLAKLSNAQKEHLEALVGLPLAVLENAFIRLSLASYEGQYEKTAAVLDIPKKELEKRLMTSCVRRVHGSV